jgi:hypothetical protein
LAKCDVAMEERAEGVADYPVPDAQAACIRLDLLADSPVAEEETVEILISLTEQDLVRLQIEPAEDTQTGLVEISPDGGVGRTPFIEKEARGSRLPMGF